MKTYGEDHLVMISASSRDGSVKGAVSGFNPKTGAFLWSYDGWQCRTPAPNVTEIGKNRLFITGGYKAGGDIIQIEKNGNSYGVKEILLSKEFGTHVHPAILYKDHLYGHCTNNDARDGEHLAVL